MLSSAMGLSWNPSCCQVITCARQGVQLVLQLVIGVHVCVPYIANPTSGNSNVRVGSELELLVLCLKTP